MLGWMIYVNRQLDGGINPGTPGCPCGPHLAVWQTGLGGLDWLNALAEQGKAINLGGNGYPLWYTARAKELISFVAVNPPMANDTWIIGPHDYVLGDYLGTTTIDSTAIAECAPDEWLVVEAWDES
jgi:hypothetical protein